MLFSSLIFIFVFLPSVLIVNYLLPFKAKNYWLLFASLVFYAWGEPKFIIVMLSSVIINYFLGLLINKNKDNKHRAKFYLILALIINLSIIGIFKYLNFAISNIDHIFGDIFQPVDIALPIGISFFTFQAISYIMDVYRGTVNIQKNPFLLALYITFFPQMIAGPIVRYNTVQAQIKKREVTLDGFSEGVRRFIIGLSKKVIISNNLALIADQAFLLADAGDISVTFAWLGALAYTLQIYFDFAGYSDMAIGLALMFGFRFLENFNYPYLTKSVSEFWRRWHISLGDWFRDYVYFPLGGSRVKSKLLLIRNLFIVWFFTGLWHGANWTFIIWGLLYFILITFEKLTKIPHRFKSKYSITLYRLFTLFCVMIGWVIFRSPNIHDALLYIESMFGLNGNVFSTMLTNQYFLENWILLLVGIAYSCAFFKYAKEKINNIMILRIGVDGLAVIVYIGLFFVAISYLVIGAYNPFIYFNF